MIKKQRLCRGKSCSARAADAAKNYLLPQINCRENLQWLAYAEEADILNVALFGFTAKAWREAHPELAKK